jgi:DNA-nicking Smr family endonuclease
MDFGEILEEWELGEKKEKHDNKKKLMNEYLGRFEPGKNDRIEKENDGLAARARTAEMRRKLRLMKPQRSVDLHRLSVEEALRRIAAFIGECRKDNIRKILIIHGKGRHSVSDPVLGKRILQYIQNCPFTGEYGIASKEMGGRGALWVILR